MKSIIAVVLAGFIATVSAVGLSDLPSCSLPCISQSLMATGCAITDFQCACSSPAFVSGAKTCIDKACSPADQQKALAVSQGLCGAAGLPISIATAPASNTSIPTTSAATSGAPAESTHASNTTTGVHTPTPTGDSPPEETTSNAATRLGAMGGVVALGLGFAAAFAI